MKVKIWKNRWSE